MGEINYLAAGAAALSSFVIGGLWYSVLFRQAWMAANRFTEADLPKGHEGRTFGIAFVLSLVMAFNLAGFLAGPETTPAWGATAGALAGIGWVVPAIATVALFEGRPFSYIAINGGYYAVAFTVMGAILGSWR